MTPSTTTYNPGDIVFVPFPFSDLTGEKKRPAVVISDAWFNNSQADLILVAVTSQIPDQLSQTDIPLTSADLKMSNLPKEGIVKPTKIVTLEKKKIIKKIGRVSPETMGKIFDSLKKLFHLN